MPIVARRRPTHAEPRSRLLRFDRPAGRGDVVATIGVDPAGDVPHELARLALDLVVRTAEPIDVPARWTTFAFASEVDRTRAQLAPIRTRAGLVT